MERRVDNGVLFHAGTGVCETFLQGCPFLKRSLVNGLRLRARKNGVRHYRAMFTTSALL